MEGEGRKLGRRVHKVRFSQVICGFTELRFGWLNAP
jgi:hypothetical protein